MARFDVDRAFRFLNGLARNNDRDWFNDHKDEWKEISADFEALVAKVIGDLVDLDPGLAKVDPRKAIFRLNRDVRFSKDKSPYKTVLSAVVSSAGKSPGLPGGYVALGPGQSATGSGLYEPEKDQYEKIRKAIDRDGATLRRILAAPALKKRFPGGLAGESFVRVPKPWDADHPLADLLRHKSFFVMRDIPDAELKKSDPAKLYADHLRAADPLRAFLVASLGGKAAGTERRSRP